jgi:basic membrane protein A and related proteins
MAIRTRGAVAAMGVVSALFAVACSSSSAKTASGGPWGWPGNPTTGYLAPHEPHVQGKSTVTIEILSPGDTHDHGYYESFVDEAEAYAKQNGWKVVTVDKVADSQAAQAARNACAQHPDMVAIAASELNAAIPVAAEPVCKNTVWYVAGGQGVTQTPYFVQTTDIESQDGYASGVAAGLLMKDSGATKAGFITGPEASFTTGFYNAWAVGLKAELPSADVLPAAYTGSFDDSAKAVEAYNAMKSQGVGILYPYLGGATDAVAAAANKDNIPVLTPGTDRCSSTSPKYAVSVIFDPGTYFAAALAPFAQGKLYVGHSLTFHMGVDPVPTVKICDPQGDDAATLANVIHQIGTGQIRPDKLTGLNDYGTYVPGSGS